MESNKRCNQFGYIYIKFLKYHIYLNIYKYQETSSILNERCNQFGNMHRGMGF